MSYNNSINPSKKTLIRKCLQLDHEFDEREIFGDTQYANPFIDQSLKKAVDMKSSYFKM